MSRTLAETRPEIMRFTYTDFGVRTQVRDMETFKSEAYMFTTKIYSEFIDGVLAHSQKSIAEVSNWNKTVSTNHWVRLKKF
jgi:hypothetical protein